MANINGTTGDDILTQNVGEDDQLDGLGGTDTLDLSAMGEGARLYLALTTPQTIGPGQGHDTILNIENAIGTGFDDVIISALLGSRIDGGDGNDTLLGRNGNDVLNGGPDNDFISGAGGNDHLDGLNGNDVLRGGPGTNVLDGSSGLDRADYSTSSEAVFASLLSQTALDKDGSGDFRDTLISIEELNGSAHGDTLVGNDLNNKLFGLEGDDFLDGRGGIDTLAGGSGDDVLLGGDGRGQYYGGTGNDYFRPGTGRDTIVGEDGTDTIDYSRQTDGLFINLQSGRAFELDGSLITNHRIYTIENAVGTDAKDTMVGNDGDNLMQANDGDDHIDGKGGDDVLDGRAGNDTILGGDGDDQLIGGDGDDYLRPGLGNDIVKGGAGIDRLDLSSRDAGVTLRLGETKEQSGLRLDSIEEVIGTPFDDFVFDTHQTERVWGGDGNDTFTANVGADEFYGEDGDDLVQTLTQGFESLDGGAGYDTWVLFNLYDTFDFRNPSANTVTNIEFVDMTDAFDTTLILTQENILAMGGDVSIHSRAENTIDMSLDNWTYVGVEARESLGDGLVFEDGSARVFITQNASIVMPGDTIFHNPSFSIDWDSNRLGEGELAISGWDATSLTYEFGSEAQNVEQGQVALAGGEGTFPIDLFIDTQMTHGREPLRDGHKPYDGEIILSDDSGRTETIEFTISVGPTTQHTFDGEVWGLSDNGRYAVAIQGEQVRLYDVSTETFEVASITADGSPPNSPPHTAAISPDGRYVAFASSATNLHPDDTNRGSTIYLYDSQTNQMTIASRDEFGTVMNDAAVPTFLDDNETLAFGFDDKIYFHDLPSGNTTEVFDTHANSRLINISRNGEAISYHEYAVSQIDYQWQNITNGNKKLIHAVDLQEDFGDRFYKFFGISADGERVVYEVYVDNYTYTPYHAYDFDAASGTSTKINGYLEDPFDPTDKNRFSAAPYGSDDDFITLKSYDIYSPFGNERIFLYGGSFFLDHDNSVLAHQTKNTFTVSGDTARDLYAGQQGNINIIYAQQYGGTLVGQDRGDLLIGAYFSDDILNGKAGDDTLIGRGGADTLIGGDGDDLLVPFGANSRALGGDGFDTVDLSSAYSHVNIDLSIKGFQTISEPYGAIQLLDIEKIIGGNNNSNIRGTRNDETLIGGDGGDRLHGGGGADTLIGNDGDDWFFAHDFEFELFDGGMGEDVFGASRDGLRLDLADLAPGQMKNIEVLFLGPANDGPAWFTLSADDVAELGGSLILYGTPFTTQLNLLQDDWTYLETIDHPVWDELDHYQSGNVDLFVSHDFRPHFDSFLTGFEWADTTTPQLTVNYASKSGQSYDYALDNNMFTTSPANGFGEIVLDFTNPFGTNGNFSELEFYHEQHSREDFWIFQSGKALTKFVAAGTPTAVNSDGTKVLIDDGNEVRLYDVETKSFDLISRSDTNIANGASSNGQMSADGRYIVYQSQATNLDVADTDGKQDIYLHDTNTGLSHRVSVAPDGSQFTVDSENAKVSSDGNIISFEAGSQLYLFNRTNDTVTEIGTFADHDLSADGSTLALISQNSFSLYDIASASISIGYTGQFIDLSPDGSKAFYQTSSSTNDGTLYQLFESGAPLDRMVIGPSGDFPKLNANGHGQYTRDTGELVYRPLDGDGHWTATYGTGAFVVSGDGAAFAHADDNGHAVMRGDKYPDLIDYWDDGFNMLRATGNDSLLLGDYLPDFLQGDRGDDIITGAGSNDMLIGGTGNDFFVINYGDGADTILDFVAGAGTEDVIDVSDFGFTSLADFTITQQGSDTLVDFGSASALLKGVTASNLHSDDFILT